MRTDGLEGELEEGREEEREEELEEERQAELRLFPSPTVEMYTRLPPLPSLFLFTLGFSPYWTWT